MSDWKDFIRNLLRSPGYELPPLPRALRPELPKPALTAEQVAARDMIEQYGFDHGRMAVDGVLEDYLALGIDADTEALWYGEYAERLLKGTAEDLGKALVLAVDNGDAALLCDVGDALDSAVHGWRIRDTEALTLMGKLLDALEKEPFAGDAEALLQGRIHALELSDALASRLADAGDDVQTALYRIRSRLEDAGVERLTD